MRKAAVFLLLIMALVSCNKKDTGIKPETKTPVSEKSAINASELAGKVFKISSQFNPKDCTAYSDGCDCCEGELIFLENGTFFDYFYCIPEEIYNFGTYTIENNRIKLTNNVKSAGIKPIDEENPGSKDTLVTEINKPYTYFLKTIPCQKLALVSEPENGEVSYYSESKERKLPEAVRQYKKSGVWQILDMKE